MDSFDSTRDALRRNGFTISMVMGSSMRPLIWGGQHYAAVVPLDGEPKVGDLLLFVSPLPRGKHKNVVHRLVEVRDEGGERVYLTRGDNCLGCERVRADEIIGRVAEVHRTSGWRPWHAIHAKRFAVTDRAYRRYSRLWQALWPVRRVCYRLRGYAQAAIGRLRRPPRRAASD